MQKEIVYEDKTLRCHDCSESFVWSAGEQRFFEQRSLAKPLRCKPCRKLRRQQVYRVEVQDG